MPIILGGSSAAAGAFAVDNCCRFNPGDTPYMSKTPGGAGNQKTWTYSCWVKKTKAGARQGIINVNGSSDPYFFVEFIASDKLNIQDYDGSQDTDLITTAVYRDVGAWYHICVAYDTTQAVDTNRIKLYVNGTQVTDFSTATYCAQDFVTQMNSTYELFVGRAATQYFGGYMAEVCVIDGQQLDATSFGEFDSDSPTIWKPIDISALTAGTNGFHLDFQDSANLGNDAFGGTDLGETNLTASDQGVDSPTNNFCTMNSLYYPGNARTLVEGNCKVTPYSSNGVPGTMGVKKGKWYFETIPLATHFSVGIVSDTAVSGGYLYEADFANGYNGYDGNRAIGYAGTGSYQYLMMAATTTTSWGATINGSTDILQVAMDLDNSKLYFGKNNAWQNSGDPTSGATGTGAVSITAYATLPALGDIWWFPLCNSFNTTVPVAFNFGGCSAFDVSSAQSDGNEYGNFEYEPPSGYYALCTKNLAEFG